MNFFFDAMMSHCYAQMLQGLCDGNHEIVHITRHPDFASKNVYAKSGKIIGNSTIDTEYINTLRDSGIGWKIVSGDMDIIDTAHERATLLASGLTFFAMDRNWGKANFSEQAWKLVKIWDQIVDRASNPDPALYRLNMGRQLSIETIKTGMRARGGRFRG